MGRITCAQAIAQRMLISPGSWSCQLIQEVQVVHCRSVASTMIAIYEGYRRGSGSVSVLAEAPCAWCQREYDLAILQVFTATVSLPLTSDIQVSAHVRCIPGVLLPSVARPTGISAQG